ncbi:MAG: hypothetical protein HOE90_22395 [Bacteriovoracaceae bacterium]|nr:hypothetical protein [Bacteriovoracaceae bacterium]
MKVFGVLIAIQLLVSFSSVACDQFGQTGFMPENDLNIPVQEGIKPNMTQKEFNTIIGDIAAIYRPIIKKLGGKLYMNNKWKSGTVNASAMQFLSFWMVNMYGGLARHPLVTPDGFALVVCHEMGHHMAGYPKIGNRGWASNEGQADYWGNLKCMRKYLEGRDNIGFVSKLTVDKVVEAECNAVYKTAEENALCKRTSMAGLSLAKLLNSLKKGSKAIDFTTPDRSITKAMNDKHPPAQCRLDTYFAGSLCTKDKDEDVSNKKSSDGVCTRDDGYKEGTRPLCWFSRT